MKVAFSTGRPAHAALPANLLVQNGAAVTIYSAAPRSRFRGLSPAVRMRWAPQFVSSFHFLTGIQLPRFLQRADTALFDHLVAIQMHEFDLFWGWATGALAAGRAARRRGARFVLDRACPHVDVQQALVREESERLGVSYPAEPAWFRERQLAEYEEADWILVPSEYSRRSFPGALQAKVMIAPLAGRIARLPCHSVASTYIDQSKARHELRPFTFGTVGGQPLRKGFLYLLEAWERLRLPNARLLIRTDARLDGFPALRDLLRRLPDVEQVGYVRDMNEFYRRCDAFVLPTLDDGFGMALLEAMAHGLPSVTTTHCGAAEGFRSGEDLLVVPARDADALAEAMESIYSSPQLRALLGRQGREAVRKFESDGSFKRYAQIVGRILGQAPHRIQVTR
jgi:glycosyltransferase involved in cell wall biosynthesis